MIVKGKSYRTIWLSDDKWSVNIINQLALPHQFIIRRLKTLEDAINLEKLVKENDIIFALTHNYSAYTMIREAK